MAGLYVGIHVTRVAFKPLSRQFVAGDCISLISRPRYGDPRGSRSSESSLRDCEAVPGLEPKLAAWPVFLPTWVSGRGRAGTRRQGSRLSIAETSSGRLEGMQKVRHPYEIGRAHV